MTRNRSGRAAVRAVAAVGAGGYFLRRAEFPLAPILMGLVLGDILELAFRRSLNLSLGDPMIFLTRPLSATLIIFSVAFFFYRVWAGRRQRARDASIGEA